MNGVVFAALMIAGGGAIALWIDERFPNLGPKDLRATMVHVAASMLVALLIVPMVMPIAAAEGAAIRTLTAIFCVAFPALTYCLLASIWAIKVFQAHLRH